MRVLLVNPASKVWNSRTHIHMGLGYLAGSLRAGGHDVALHDGEIEDEDLSARLDHESYELVGVSSPTPLIREAFEAARVARRHGAFTVLGGPHPTLQPDECMGEPAVDLVLRGEGEDGILEIIAALQGDAGLLPDGPAGPRRFNAPAWSNILGLSWRNADGQIVHNASRPLRQDLDSIPWPAYDLFRIERYTNLQPLTDGLDPHARTYTIVTSRGCPYQCIYCSKPITGHTWRPRQPAEVVREWAYLVREMRATEIGVTDDVWNLSLERAKEICRLLIHEGLTGVPWVTIHGMRAYPADQELFELMKRAGCKRVGFGVESGSQRVLDYIKKKQRVEDVRQAFAWAKAAGLQTMGFFIYGLPTETEATMEETTRLALELDPDLGNFMIATPYPGTELYEIVKAEGRLLSKGWDDLGIHADRAHYEIGELTAELVERKWHSAYRRFYLRPSRVWRRLRMADTWRRLPLLARDSIRFLVGRKP
jgi:anaerobic magnesium-protoporphyrin IX monomethyl ester cyclase